MRPKEREERALREAKAVDEPDPAAASRSPLPRSRLSQHQRDLSRGRRGAWAKAEEGRVVDAYNPQLATGRRGAEARYAR
jgi:hypothetical protein